MRYVYVQMWPIRQLTALSVIAKMSVGYNEQFNALATIVQTATMFLPDRTTRVAQLGGSKAPLVML